MEAYSTFIGSDYPKALRRIRLLGEDDPILLDAVRLIDGTGAAPEENMAVLVTEGRIRWVGPTGTAPPETQGSTRLDGKGKTLMPGLMDCHVHLSGEAGANAYRRYLDPPHQVRLLRSATDAFDALASGFTTVRDAGTAGGGPFALRRAINDGIIMGPSIYAAGDALSQSAGHGDWHTFPYDWVKSLEPRARLVDGVAECRKAVRLNFRQGADFIKVFLASGGVTNSPEDLHAFPEFSMDELRAIVDEAHRREKRVAAHVAGARSVLHGLEGGVDTMEHGLFGPDRAVLERMAEADVFFCPTLSIFYWIATEGEKWGVFPGGIEAAKVEVENQHRMVSLAREVGVKLASSSDCGSKYGRGNLAKELELMAGAGLGPMGAIVAATRTAAECIGIEGDVGTVEVGKRADLLLVDGDPLSDISILQNRDAITMVMKSPPNA